MAFLSLRLQVCAGAPGSRPKTTAHHGTIQSGYGDHHIESRRVPGTHGAIGGKGKHPLHGLEYLVAQCPSSKVMAVIVEQLICAHNKLHLLFSEKQRVQIKWTILTSYHVLLCVEILSTRTSLPICYQDKRTKTGMQSGSYMLFRLATSSISRKIINILGRDLIQGSGGVLVVKFMLGW